MKKSRIITLVLAVIMMSFTACQNDSDEVTSDLDALELESDAAMESTFQSVDQASEDGISYVNANARGDEAGPREGLADCAEVTHDVENQTITIDFGDGCEDRLGNIKKGKIVIEYNDRAYVPGSYKIVTFVDFYINDIKVEGTRTITLISATETEREFTIELVGGKLDFGDGTFITRDGSWVRIWFVDENKTSKSGIAEGININGIDYSEFVDASTPLNFLRECSQRLAVSGIKEMVVGDRSATIDYGDGECDRIITVTIDGETFTREITPRRGRERN